MTDFVFQIQSSVFLRNILRMLLFGAFKFHFNINVFLGSQAKEEK